MRRLLIPLLVATAVLPAAASAAVTKPRDITRATLGAMDDGRYASRPGILAVRLLALVREDDAAEDGPLRTTRGWRVAPTATNAVASIITSGFRDDSVAGARRLAWMAKGANGRWRITKVTTQWICPRGVTPNRALCL